MPLSAADCPNVLPGQELHQSAGTAPGIKNEVKTEPGLRNVPAFYWVLKACLYSPQVPHFGEMMWGAHMALFFFVIFHGSTKWGTWAKRPIWVYKIEGHPTFVQLSHSGWDQLDSQGPGGPM